LALDSKRSEYLLAVGADECRIDPVIRGGSFQCILEFFIKHVRAVRNEADLHCFIKQNSPARELVDGRTLAVTQSTLQLPKLSLGLVQFRFLK